MVVARKMAYRLGGYGEMRVRKRGTDKVSIGAVDGAIRREVEADVLEIWMVASRLLGRLTESRRARPRRKALQRGRTVKTAAPRSALTP